MAKDPSVTVMLEAGKLSASLDRAADELVASFAGIPFPVPPDDRPTFEHMRASLARAERQYADDHFVLEPWSVGDDVHLDVDVELDPVVTVATMLLEMLAVAPVSRLVVSHSVSTTGGGDDVQEVSYAIEDFPAPHGLPATTMSVKLQPAGLDTLVKSIATGPRVADVPTPVTPEAVRRVVRLWRKERMRRPSPSALVDALDVQCAHFADWLHGTANMNAPDPRDGEAQVARLGDALDELDAL